jgi:hypothetical protein
MTSATKLATLLFFTISAMPSDAALASCYGRNAGETQTRFKLSGDEARDTSTGLIWKRCSLGTRWDGKRRCEGEPAAANFDEARAAAEQAGSGWRVPSGPELETIVDTGCGRPVVDTAVFTDIKPDADSMAKYWTTNEVGAANLVYYFDFMNGAADGHSRGFQLSVRLVRTGP